jgi:hypothetical protein
MKPDRAPSICQTIAKRVARLLRKYGALNHWREMVRAAFTEFMERLRGERHWSEQRAAHYKTVWERIQKGESEPNEPPAEGWIKEFGHVHLDGVFPLPTLLTWVPPELSDANMLRANLPLPLPEGEQLSLASCYTVLAAIHDATLKGVEYINPWKAAKETMPPAFGAWYYGLPNKARELPASDAASLLVILERVEEHLQNRVAVKGATETAANPKLPKRSTRRGDANAKIVSALTKHHQYADGGCLNPEPIGSNELARLAEVAKRSTSKFFKDKFKGYDKYRVVCRDTGRLADSLKTLNGDFSPHDLYGRRPAGEDDRDNTDE